MSEKVDKVLSGIIIILIVVVVWKWFQSSNSCSDDVLPCGCKMGQCNCAQISRQMPQRQMPQRQMSCNGSGFTGNNNKIGKVEPKIKLTVNGVPEDSDLDAIIESHDSYIKGNGFNGLAQGSSSNTVLEETGRSYGTSDFVGLTARKFCKARELARPASESRVVPSNAIEESCHIDMNELV